MALTLKKSLNGGKTILSVYIVASIISYLFVLVTGTWNGDYIGRENLLNVPVLSIVLLLTILPSVYCFYIFKYNLRYENVRIIKYNINIIRNITWFLFIAHIFLLMSGYGVMGTEGTRIGLSPLSIMRSVLLKFSPRLWGITYILISNNNRNILVTYLLFFISSVFAHSLGGLFLVFIISIYKYKFIWPFIKKHLLLSVGIAIAIPAMITAAYNFRGQLRGFGNMVETDYTDIVFGKLCGRISSLSNNGYILENMPILIMDSDNVPTYFYLYDPMHFWGIHPAFKSTGSYVDETLKRTGNPNSSTMAGPLGVLIISISKSAYTFIVNLIFILTAIPLLFLLLRKMRIKNLAGIGLILSLGFAQNGDSSDIANNMYGLLFMWIILSISHKIHVKN